MRAGLLGRMSRGFVAAVGGAALLTLAGCGSETITGDPFEEVVPSCGPLDAPDQPWRAGCATRRNLAALAANPQDLYLARRETPRDAMRRDAVISNYAQSRAGASSPQTTAATASPSINAQPQR